MIKLILQYLDRAAELVLPDGLTVTHNPYYSTLILMSTAAFGPFGVRALYPGLKTKHEGIVAGEIVAWRCWRIDEKTMKLHSTAVDAEWPYDEPMQGDVAANGVHAFKSLQFVKEYLDGSAQNWFAVGTIDLWGEIVEHERGYRAEYGKVSGLLRVIPPGFLGKWDLVKDMVFARVNIAENMLRDLRVLYNVGAPAIDSNEWTGR